MKRLQRAVLASLVMIVLAVCQQGAPPIPERMADELPPAVTVPARGTSSQLDIASWNVEWFGAPSNGPVDERLQLARIRDVIRGTDADIWGMVEVVDPAAWARLQAELPGYAGVLASEPAVAGGPANYSRGEQKVGFLYKTGAAALRGARVVLGDEDVAFAGRPPLEATFRVTVDGRSEDLVIIVLHMKAFADSASRRRRETAAGLLKGYLDATHPTRRVAVIGDWNDDVDASIVPGAPTPFASFVRDSARYRFVTMPLSRQRISSTTGYADLIDHHLVTDELAREALAGASEVYRVDAFLPAYERTTSDHFPVISHYRLGR